MEGEKIKGWKDGRVSRDGRNGWKNNIADVKNGGEGRETQRKDGLKNKKEEE